MIFYCDLQGNLKAFQNETVYQGSNNVTTIYVVAPFSRPVGLNISFTKPNKLVTSPAIMKWVGTLGNVKIPVSFVNIPEQFTDTYNVWAYALPYSITEQNGVVGVSVNAVIADSVDANGQQAYKGNLTTFTGQFTVAYSALPSPPTDIPTEWTQDKVLDLLNNYYNDAIQKIGEMNTLKTDAKDTLVKAINEVFDEIASTNATIGDLSTLTTDEKGTIVGAINEVDAHANTAQQTAEAAQTTADNATTLANNAVATANGAVATANGAKTIAEQAKTIATNSVYSVSFEDIQSAVTALNGYDNAYFKVGNSIYLKQKDVPDMWVYAVASEYIEYTYTTDDDFVNALLLGTVQVGYYVLANLESTGDYDVLKNKPIINQDLSADGFTPVENTYYRHTGTTSETYTAGVIYFYNGTAYKAIDGAGGETPTALPQEASALKSGNLPTSGWNTSASKELFYGNLNFAGYSSPATDNGKILPPYNYTSKTSTSDWTGTQIREKNIKYCEQKTDGDGKKYISLYWNSGYGINSKKEAEIQIYDDGTVKAWHQSNGAYAETVKIVSTFLSDYIYTISDTSITANSDVLMELTDEGGVKSYSMEAGKITVIRDTVPTQPIPYTYKVKQTNASGQFTVLNHYLPSIPETPTALPQEASALKSGNLPTSGWEKTGFQTFWEGTAECGASTYKPIGTSKELADILYSDDTAYMMVDYNYYSSGNHNQQNVAFSYKNSNVSVNGMTGISFRSDFQVDNPTIFIARDGTMYGRGSNFAASSYAVTYTRIGTSTISQQFYTISDTSITANSDVLMELTDEGGVKSYSMEAGKITVIRDTVPTSPIPYTYKVKQTNASGQFTVLNHFAGVTSVNGQTGAVTIAVPTKTSELINDSGYVSNLPIVRNVVCNDVDSAATLDTTITCEVGDLILAQIIVRSALTLPTGWTLLRTIPAVETTYNQTLSFAYKRATSTSETLTVTQATAGRIYTNLVRLSNATSISYIQSCEKTITGAQSISSTKPVTPNMVIWGASSTLWQSASPRGDWTYTPSTLDYYSLPQSTSAPRLGTFVDSSGAGERTFTANFISDSSSAMMCGAVEIVGDEVARKGDIPTKTSELTNDSGFITAADIGNALYPVGSIYMSVNNTNPSTFFGGTWEAWGAGKVPVGVDTNDTDFATVEKTGGEKTHTLTESEIPAHRHTVEAIGTGTTQQELNAFSVDNQGAVDSYGTTNTAGGGQAHNNLQPYITCYMWKRIN